MRYSEPILLESEQQKDGFLIDNQGMVLDAASTTAALASGFVELNPLVSGVCGSNPVVVGICVFGGKKLLEKGVEAVGKTSPDYKQGSAQKISNTIGYFGGCANLTALAIGSGPFALGVGVLCATTYWHRKAKAEQLSADSSNASHDPANVVSSASQL